ncbi:leucine-rich repeat and coiled-coil domain-containing protein 1-like [Meleagris gallopavo]|uniref:leucine-rich repeat and coiled-coil domain-containing protein 1-like n=1 Tax=Meleagris gallopavo TaxID=9103 RepID=UPI00093A51EF|nr:leucine-rich repeat and coiled-coil domain-containing protein 1-like [Meleagris gallopavo]
MTLQGPNPPSPLPGLPLPRGGGGARRRRRSLLYGRSVAMYGASPLGAEGSLKRGGVMAGQGGEPVELSLVDKGVRSLLEVSLSSDLHTLNMHCNRIARIEGLGHLRNLQHLDLSSNQIRRMEGLSALESLRSLNLSCNLITAVEGLEKLFNLTTLNLSYNRIHNLSGK